MEISGLLCSLIPATSNHLFPFLPSQSSSSVDCFQRLLLTFFVMSWVSNYRRKTRQAVICINGHEKGKAIKFLVFRKLLEFHDCSNTDNEILPPFYPMTSRNLFSCLNSSVYSFNLKHVNVWTSFRRLSFLNHFKLSCMLEYFLISLFFSLSSHQNSLLDRLGCKFSSHRIRFHERSGKKDHI